MMKCLFNKLTKTKMKKVPWYTSTATIISTLAFAIIWLGLAGLVNIPNPPQITHTGQPDNDFGGSSYEVSCYTGYESHGANGRVDGVSVATYQFPQGTKLLIEGFGKRRVDTVTAKRFSHRVDVWWGETYEDYLDCLNFGTQLRKITIIK